MLRETLENAEAKETREIAKTPESGLTLEEGRGMLDHVLDLSEMRLEYQKPQMHSIAFGSSCTT